MKYPFGRKIGMQGKRKIVFLQYNKAISRGIYPYLFSSFLIHQIHYPKVPSRKFKNEHHTQCDSVQLISEKINEINPEFVLIWNGWYCTMQELIIKNIKPNIKILYTEWGWFPQRQYISFHKNGTNTNSDLVHTHFSGVPDRVQLQQSRLSYVQRAHIPDVKDYIFIPLQMEGDTQLMYNKGVLNSQTDMVRFVRSQFPNKTIVIKAHPQTKLMKEEITLCQNYDCIYVHDKNIAGWMLYADFVVGLNSTVLIESIFLYKKVVAFGTNVYCNKDVFLDCTKDIMNIKNIDSFVMDKKRKYKIDQFITLLLGRQFVDGSKYMNRCPDERERFLTLLDTMYEED